MITNHNSFYFHFLKKDCSSSDYHHVFHNPHKCPRGKKKGGGGVVDTHLHSKVCNRGKFAKYSKKGYFFQTLESVKSYMNGEDWNFKQRNYFSLVQVTYETNTIVKLS